MVAFGETLSVERRHGDGKGVPQKLKDKHRLGGAARLTYISGNAILKPRVVVPQRHHGNIIGRGEDCAPQRSARSEAIMKASREVNDVVLLVAPAERALILASARLKHSVSIEITRGEA